MIEFLQPEGWRRGKGYSHGASVILQPGDRLVEVAGQIGWTGDQLFETDDLVGQTWQALRNTVAILAEAGGGPEHVLSMTWYITDRAECLARQAEMGEAYRETFGRVFPAMAMVEVRALMEDQAKVEIESRAVIPAPKP